MVVFALALVLMVVVCGVCVGFGVGGGGLVPGVCAAVGAGTAAVSIVILTVVRLLLGNSLRWWQLLVIN